MEKSLPEDAKTVMTRVPTSTNELVKRKIRDRKKLTEYCEIPSVEDVNELFFETMALEGWKDAEDICFLTLSEVLIRYLRKKSVDLL